GSLCVTGVAVCAVLCISTLFSLTATPPSSIYTLSLHDALPISWAASTAWSWWRRRVWGSGRAKGPATASWCRCSARHTSASPSRSEEHTSELQSPDHLVCRLLLEKKKTNKNN